ncbi:OmpA family protein [Porticoccaceae bacterium]|jgi:peptidoglycan-associated lipoprotein|nr:OmpA family protein [Porticoccaceae bacterium]
MNTSFIKPGLSALLLAALLTGCSSNPVVEEQQTSTDIEDTSVQTGQVDTSAIDDATVEVMTADTVFYFDFDKALLKPESRAALLEHSASLQNSPRNVRLEGHADERGTREYNMALGERRANAVKEFLVLQGVSPGLIEVISYGEERAAAYGSNDDAWGLNRRVELK